MCEALGSSTSRTNLTTLKQLIFMYDSSFFYFLQKHNSRSSHLSQQLKRAKLTKHFLLFILIRPIEKHRIAVWGSFTTCEALGPYSSRTNLTALKQLIFIHMLLFNYYYQIKPFLRPKAQLLMSGHISCYLAS